MRHKVDFLVIGSGIAGLSYALKIAAYGKVMIITKSDEDESNTKYAQGGIAAVTYAPDSFEKHVNDTLIAGDGLCDQHIVRKVIEEGPERIRELIEWGTQFDVQQDGNFHLGKEGGHSEHRILHHKDITGYEIERALIEQVKKHSNITVLDHHLAIEIITQHHQGMYVNSKTPGIKCFGAYVLDLQSLKTEVVLARITLMATGGIGQVYAATTNPKIATGDGIAMVYRAKGAVEDMEFIQFHPTALYEPGKQPSFLITEAMRGAGAVLRNSKGEAFMVQYDHREELAPRDIVARAIDKELKSSGEDFVWLDCSNIDEQEIKKHFPNIFEKCQSIGIHLPFDKIPVVPACHYLCGGIKVDEWGRSSIENLLAAGECARTGLHGANRLASNSLLEALFISHRAYLFARDHQQSVDFEVNIPEWNIEGTADNEEKVLITQSRKELQAIMSNYVGIVRSNIRLQRAHDRLQILNRETEALYQRSTLTPALIELRNLILTGYLIIKAAKNRKENRGLHYSIDLAKRLA
jgi:L-aspartate oxidase